MQLIGTPFPGVPDDSLGISQRSYAYDPAGSPSQQSSQYPQTIEPTTDNITWHTVWGDYSPIVQTYPGGGVIGNAELFQPAFFSMPNWWRGAPGPGGMNHDWDDLRQAGVGYGVYSPHLDMNPVPAWKLVSPGSGFVLPATLLGQPLATSYRPPGS